MAMAHEDMLLRIVGRQGRTYDHDQTAAPDEMVNRILATLTDRGLVRTDERYGAVIHVLTDEGKTHLSHIQITALRDGISYPDHGERPSAGDRSLMVWMLEHGGTVGTFSSGPMPDSRIWHVAACGLDWSESESPEHSSWSIFTDTFDEGDTRQQGMQAVISCQCGQVDRLSVCAELDSLVDLIKDLIT